MRAMLRRRTPFSPGLCLFAIPEGTRPASFCSSALGTRYFKSDPKRSLPLSLSLSLSLSLFLLLSSFHFVKLANSRSRMYVALKTIATARKRSPDTVFIKGPSRSETTFPKSWSLSGGSSWRVGSRVLNGVLPLELWTVSWGYYTREHACRVLRATLVFTSPGERFCHSAHRFEGFSAMITGDD